MIPRGEFTIQFSINICKEFLLLFNKHLKSNYAYPFWETIFFLILPCDTFYINIYTWPKFSAFLKFSSTFLPSSHPLSLLCYIFFAIFCIPTVSLWLRMAKKRQKPQKNKSASISMKFCRFVPRYLSNKETKRFFS